jgi:hypothetical protein
VIDSLSDSHVCDKLPDRAGAAVNERLVVVVGEALISRFRDARENFDGLGCALRSSERVEF